MNIPDTPKSILVAMRNKEAGPKWENAWKILYDIYYSTMRVMTKNQFKKINWGDIDEGEIEEVISSSVLSIIETFQKDKYLEGYRFRGFLKTIIARRVIDYVRLQNKKRTIAVESIELLEAIHNPNMAEQNEYFAQLEENEEREYQKGVLLDAWENIRTSLSPQTALIFSLSQLEGKSTKEITDLLDVERNIVDSTIHRVLKKLRKKLSENNYRKELKP